MTSSRTRVMVLSSAFAVALGVVLLHLWFLMVQQQEAWARRSYENRWAFRSVPSQRGMLFDRHGELLAWDEPTTRASIYYRRFRVYHVVGAAVHGATHWSELVSDGAGATYTIAAGVLGPRVAAADLMNVPVRALKPGVLTKKQFAPLATYATTVLSACSGMPRKKVYAAIREAAIAGQDLGIGDVLPMSRSEMLEQFDDKLADLRALDQRFQVEQQKHNQRIGRTKVDATLLETLEKLRRFSLEKRKIVLEVEENEQGEKVPVKFGSLIEDVRRYFAQDVDFELAAALRVDQKSHPGISVDPAIRRMRRGGRDTSLGVMIGEVRSNDRLVWKTTDESGKAQRHNEPSMPEDWQEELVPIEVVGDTGVADHMRREAERRFRRETLVNERSGISGFEALCDDDLTGKLGMRFVEHDSRHREHRLWSHLRVESGKDVRMTIDARLQDIAEFAVRQSDGKYRPSYDKERDLRGLESAIAIIDAHTGDILAMAGAPIRGESTRRVPGLRWVANGSIGSVVKPFVLLEHLESERLGRPHLARQDIKPCKGFAEIGPRKIRYGCDHLHWGEGQAPRAALAKSCNAYFYQTGYALGGDGVWRALRRFGLSEPPADDWFAECWQPRIRGLPIAVPFVDTNIVLARRSIGYGVQAPPLYVARAYAGIATGILPDVGLRLGEPRRVIPLGDIDQSLAKVREGMVDCVLRGTGDGIGFPGDWEVHGKTGTAEISRITKQNNGWFAGYFPWTGRGGMQLAFAAVVYRVPKGVSGAEAAGALCMDFFHEVQSDPELLDRYLTR